MVPVPSGRIQGPNVWQEKDNLKPRGTPLDLVGLCQVEPVVN